MQQGLNALFWFMNMVGTGAINPMNPDMSLVPDGILAELNWKRSPDGKIIPTQAAVNVTLFLLIVGKIAVQISQETVQGTANEDELCCAIDKFLLLAGFEKFKRAGFLKYQAQGAWHNGEGKILITDFKPQPMGLAITPTLKTYFNFN
jgi:hypothetical protein